MDTFSLSHLTDSVLLCNLTAVVARERTATAEVLAHIAEVDERKLYVSAGFSSMLLYCVEELHFSEEAARKRIHAARAARRFPAIFTDLAEGRLHLSAVVMLAPYLSQENAKELLAGASRKTKFEIEQLIAACFPRLDVPTMVRPILASTAGSSFPTDERAPGRVPEPRQVITIRPRVTPLAPERFAIEFTIGAETRDLLQYAQSLLSHAIPSGDVAQVFHRVLELAIPELEKQKFAATSNPRRSRRSSANSRYIPAHVKRAVWQRDQGQCTFVSEKGHRCKSRRFLEFDHVNPVARGGQATVAQVRLRCSAHNQLEAERTFGAEFIKNKREEAKRTAAARAAAKAREKEEARAEAAAAAERAKERDVIPWLRALGCRPDQARHAAKLCESIPDAPLEERVRLALSYLSPRGRVLKSAAPTS